MIMIEDARIVLARQASTLKWILIVERYGSLLGHIILNPCQPDSDILNVLLRSSKYQFDIIWFDTTGEHSLYDRCGCVRHLVLYCLKHIFTISLYNCYRLCHIHVAVAHILSVNVACCHLSVYERIFFYNIMTIQYVSLRKFYGRHHDLVDRYEKSVSQMTTNMFHLS